MRRSLLLAVGAGLLPVAYRASLRAVLRWANARLNEGDVEPLLRLYAEDATLVFPGASSWGGTYRGRAEIGGFLRRFVAAGLRGEIEDAVISGPPWRTTVCVRFSDEARGADGAVVYSNEAILVARSRWGRIVHQEDFEDTERVAAFDRYLAERGIARA